MNTISAHKYSVIYADPPWRFKNFSVKGEGRNAISHYDCMSVAQLKELADHTATLALSAAMGAHARIGGVGEASRRKDPPQLTFG